MALEISPTQKSTLSVKPVNRKGKPLELDGEPTWSTDNTDVLALDPASDGLSCEVTAVGPAGSGFVTFRAAEQVEDGDPAPLIGTLEVVVTAGNAAKVAIDATKPIEVDAEPPEPADEEETPVQPSTATSGEFVSLAGNVLTLSHGGGTNPATSHEVDPAAAVSLNGNPATRDDLRSGDKIQLSGKPATAVAATR